MLFRSEVFKPVVEYKSIALRGLPRESNELRIVQLSDLHFTGKVGIEYFKRIVALCNEANPDLVLLTGDVVDKAHCLDWLEKTLGPSSRQAWALLRAWESRSASERNWRIASRNRSDRIRAAQWPLAQAGDSRR